jgi:hypothetical protein
MREISAWVRKAFGESICVLTENLRAGSIIYYEL